MLVVITPAATHNLTTKEVVKEDLGLTGTSQDALIDRLIAEASAAINTYCRRPTFGLEVVRQTEYLVHENAAVILDRDLVPTITGVSFDGTAVVSTEYQLDGSRLWRLDAAGYRRSWGIGKLVIDYSAGYNLLGNLPRDIERACLDTVRELYFDRARDPNLRSEKILDIIEQAYTSSSASTRAVAIPSSAQEKLKNYQDWVIV